MTQPRQRRSRYFSSASNDLHEAILMKQNLEYPSPLNSVNGKQFSYHNSNELFKLDDKNPNHYAAIYEYAQGSFPVTVWSHGKCFFKNQDKFKLYVVNLPVSLDVSTFSFQPIVVVSSYDNFYYVAYYFDFYDIEARGFSRFLVFVDAHSQCSIIESIKNLYNDKIFEILKQIFTISINEFTHGLAIFAASLDKVIQNDPEIKTILISKMNQLKPILDHFSIQIDPSLAITRPANYFTQINNDLRSILSFNVSESLTSLMELVNSFPTSISEINIKLLANIKPIGISLNFGGLFNEEYSNYIGKLQALADESFQFKIRSFVTRNVFYYCIYTFFSGQQLIIISHDQDNAINLAEKFSIFIPHFSKEQLLVAQKPSIKDISQYAIVVCEDLDYEKDTDARWQVSILDLDKKVYQGDGCPKTSFITKKFGKNFNEPESIFLMLQFGIIQKIESKFLLIMENHYPEEIKRTKNFSIFEKIGFSREDEPILNFWLECYCLPNDVRPHLADNHSKSGLTLIPL